MPLRSGSPHAVRGSVQFASAPPVRLGWVNVPRPDPQSAIAVAAHVNREFWVRPDGGQAVVDWLDRRHMAEVAEQPGFLWARRCRLEQDAEDGWHAHLMVYGLASRSALDA